MRATRLRANWLTTIFVFAAVTGCAAQTPAAPDPVAVSQAAAAPTVRDAASQPATAPATQAAPDPQVDKILARLEEREVRDLRAKLTWRLQYVIDPDATVKSGEIWYQQGEPVARFLIHFTERVNDSRKDKIDERHMFDGRWYVELQSQTKTYTKREIRRADDPANPYKVGEGVFPLPFGQKKADILREFEVQRIEPAKDDPPATDHLRLTPHEGTRTGESYKVLDFWISAEGATAGLPIKVRVAKKDGTGKVNSTITITFEDAKLNQGFSGNVFELTPPAGYEVYVESLDSGAPPTGETPQ